MNTHGKVIERENPFTHDRYRHLEMAGGTYAAIPAGMVCEVGDVVAVLSDAEFCVVEIYRELMKETREAMTKYEAFEAIAGVSDDISWIEYRDRILAILDQIDQPPGEFSVRELCELIGNVGLGCGVLLDSKQGFKITVTPEAAGIFSWGTESLRSKLIELAKPEDPEVMVAMPLSLVKCCAERLDGDIKLACKAALDKATL